MHRLSDQSQNLNIDDVINRLLKLQNSSSTTYFPLTQQEVQSLCYLTKVILAVQPLLLQLNAPINICGDIHGQYSDLLQILKLVGYPDQENYLFLGDYVDRGKKSLQCFCLLMAYKIKYPNNFFLLRGNHQCSELNKIYGFFDQVKRKFNLKVWKTICNVFNCLPIAAIVADRIFCVHGGLSPQLNDIRDLNGYKRPIQPMRFGPICDLLWGDPCIITNDFSQNIERGVGYLFGPGAINAFLKKYDFDLICRSHQVVQEGYEFFNDRKLITIFSAPNYCGDFQNSAAILKVDKNIKCSIEQLQTQLFPQNVSRLKRSLTPIPQAKKQLSPLKKSTAQKQDSEGKENQEDNQNLNRSPRKNSSPRPSVRKVTNLRHLKNMPDGKLSENMELQS